MAILEDLEVFLQFSLGYVPGTDLFIDFIPDSPDEVLALYEVPGGLTDETMGDGLQGIDEYVIQLLARAGPNDIPSVKNRSDAAWKALHEIINENVNGTRYLRVSRTDGPYMVDRDSNDRPVFITNMEVVKLLE